jgi:hypothetical protein
LRKPCKIFAKAAFFKLERKLLYLLPCDCTPYDGVRM